MKRKAKYKITNITRRTVKGYQNFLKMVYPEWSRAKIRAKAQRHFYWRFTNVPQNRLFFTSNSGIGVLDHEFVDQGILSIKSCDSAYPEIGDLIRGDEFLNELRLTPVSVDGMDTSHASVLKLDVSYDYAATPPQGETLPLTEMPPPFEIPVMPPQTFTVTRKDGMIVDKDTHERLNFKRYLSIPRATGGVASKNQDLYGDSPFKPYTAIPK